MAAIGANDLYRSPVATNLEVLRSLWRTHVNRVRSRLKSFGHPVVTAPTFGAGFAEGDLVVGHTLIEVKVSKTPRDHINDWLDQLLKYALFDHADTYRIETIALYLGRQSALIAWDLRDLLPILTGETDIGLTTLREEFRTVVQPLVDDYVQRHRGPSSPRHGCTDPAT